MPVVFLSDEVLPSKISLKDVYYRGIDENRKRRKSLSLNSTATLRRCLIRQFIRRTFVLSLRERAFRNVIFVCALALFLILEICFTYAIGKMFLSIAGAFLLVIAIFLLIVTIDQWRKVKEE